MLLTALIGLVTTRTAKKIDKRENSDIHTQTRQHFGDFAILNAVRWVRPNLLSVPVQQLTTYMQLLIVFFPLMILAAYSFRYSQAVGWAYTLIASIFFVLLLIAVGTLCFLLLRGRKRGLTAEDAPEERSDRFTRRFGPLFDPYKHRFAWLAIPLLLMTLVKALFVGAAQVRCHTMIFLETTPADSGPGASSRPAHTSHFDGSCALRWAMLLPTISFERQYSYRDLYQHWSLTPVRHLVCTSASGQPQSDHSVRLYRIIRSAI